MIVGWTQLGGPLPAFDSDIKVVQSEIDQINRRIDGIDKLNLYRERDRVQDKLDQLQDRYEQEPGNKALKELIRARERERDEIDRQIDALQ